MKTINIIIVIFLLLIICLQIGLFVLYEKENETIIFSKENEIIKSDHLNKEILIIQKETTITIPDEAKNWKGIIKLKHINEESFNDTKRFSERRIYIKFEKLNIIITSLLSDTNGELEETKIKNDTLLDGYSIELVFVDNKVFLTGLVKSAGYIVNGNYLSYL